MEELARIASAAVNLFSRLAPARTSESVAVAAPARRPPGAVRALLSDLVAAYPDWLAAFDDRSLIWRDGSRTPLRSGPAVKTVQNIIDNPDVADIFAWDYPLGRARLVQPMGDPGRARPAALFTRMYGDCNRGEAQRHLVDVAWVNGRRVRFTRVNGAAVALAQVARDLEKLGPSFVKYLWPTSGTFNCRPIAGTTAPSMHAFGAAIDLSSRYGAYWRWGGDRGALLPPAIIDAFERRGFIWGGKWAHFDTFHFEFRPELIRAARRMAGR
jgi:hypothetical protein